MGIKNLPSCSCIVWRVITGNINSQNAILDITIASPQPTIAANKLLLKRKPPIQIRHRKGTSAIVVRDNVGQNLSTWHWVRWCILISTGNSINSHLGYYFSLSTAAANEFVSKSKPFLDERKGDFATRGAYVKTGSESIQLSVWLTLTRSSSQKIIIGHCTMAPSVAYARV